MPPRKTARKTPARPRSQPGTRSGVKTSFYMPPEVRKLWQASGLSIAEAVRLGCQAKMAQQDQQLSPDDIAARIIGEAGVAGLRRAGLWAAGDAG